MWVPPSRLNGCQCLVTLVLRSPQRSADWLSALDSLDESDGLALGPATVVAIRLGKKGAMSAALGFDIGDMRIVQQLVASLGQNANERIVFCVQDKRGHGDAFEHARGSGASVVILGVEKSAVARGNLVVEVAQAAHAAQMADFKMLGIERGLALDAPA